MHLYLNEMVLLYCHLVQLQCHLKLFDQNFITSFMDYYLLNCKQMFLSIWNVVLDNSDSEGDMLLIPGYYTGYVILLLIS